MLPCNVIVYETEPGHSVVAAMAPKAALSVVGENDALAEVANDADARLKKRLWRSKRRTGSGGRRQEEHRSAKRVGNGFAGAIVLPLDSEVGSKRQRSVLS